MSYVIVHQILVFRHTQKHFGTCLKCKEQVWNVHPSSFRSTIYTQKYLKSIFWCLTNFFDASLTLSCKPAIVADILAKLRDRSPCKTMFQKSCFGRWLDIFFGVEGDHFLLHYVFCKEVVTIHKNELEKMVFEIEENKLTFEKREFCLVTSL